jgi:ribose/xylose/arabinose/galactoside ABC-type transport system permease subunit
VDKAANIDSTNLAGAVRKRSVLEKTGKLLRRYALLAALVVLIAVAAFIEPRFISYQNIRNVLNQVSVIGILACGMTFVIISGCIDLSVGSVISITGIVVIKMVKRFGDIPGMAFALLLGALFGAVVGLIMARIDGRLGESFMVTYGAQTAFAGLAMIISGGLFLMNDTTGVFSRIGKGANPIIVFLVLIAVSQFFITRTTFGRRIYFLGANPEAARLSGIPIGRYRTLIFTLSGFIAAIAGIVLPSRVAAANPTAGVGYELDAIAAVVVGGISMKGGSGTFLNTLMGVIVIGVLGNALNILNVTSYPQMIIKGIVIAAAVSLDIWNRSMSEGKEVKKNA